MLVRFLSYAASIIGAKRYKPLLISGLAVVFSITGTFIVVSSLVSSSPDDAASQVSQQNDGKPKTGQEQTSLGNLEQKSTKDNAALQKQNSQQNDTSPDNKQAGSNASSDAPVFDITLNTSTVNLSQTSASSAVMVTITTADKGSVQWSVTPETSNGISARIEQSKDSPASAVIRFRADTIIPGVYQFTISAKPANNEQGASKTISVTVN